MTQYDPNDPTRLPPGRPVYSESVETVVVRESSTGWWIAGVLGGGVLIALAWILFARGPDTRTDDALLQARMDAAAAQANADNALIQGQVAGAQASVDIARADAARSQADAVRADSEARAAEARASTPMVIEREVEAPTPAIITSTAPPN